MSEERLYPMPAPKTDARFTIGLLLDVTKVLEQHGYARPVSGGDLIALQKVLFGFLDASAFTYDPGT